MLYPKKNEPFSDKDFANPGSEYRAAPFWSWNNKLDKQELLWQIEQLKKMGFGGFHMHVRTGMATPYLSDEFMEIVKSCVEKAREEGMLAYLYDEDRWPSGAAGGLVTKNHQYRQRYLRFSRTEPAQKNAVAVFDILLNADGSLQKYAQYTEGMPVEGFLLYVTLETAGDNPWFNNQAYLNTLDQESVQAFIHTTYDRYQEKVGEAFGNVIPSMFTDEPQFSAKQTLNYATDTRDITLPWTPDFAQTYQKTYGDDIISKLPELLWDLPEGEVSVARYHYHDHIAERFSSAFADQCGAWCEAHGLMLTGHMMQEPSLESQTGSLGETMRSYRGFQYPGIDMLCDRREFTTAKQAQSASRQYGREGVLSELYGVTNWDFDFRGHKLQGDWQAALGVTLRVPHLAWVSMNGEAKRDYPASISYQAPWFQEYAYIEDHFARVATAMTRGKALCRVGVVHPVESYWLHWGAKENTQAIREQMDEQFQHLTEWLIRGLVDFDFICESLLPSQQPDADPNEGFQVGSMRYDTILVPPVETLRKTTVERLQAFRAKGGRILFMGNAPRLMDAVPSNVPETLYAKCEHVPFDRVSLLTALEQERDIEIRDQSGARTKNLLYQMRSEGNERWIFICQADAPANKDIPQQQKLRIKMRGTWDVVYLDSLTGSITPKYAAVEDGWTVCEMSIYEQDSLLLHLVPRAGGNLLPENHASEKKMAMEPASFFLDALPVTLHEPNAALLDMPEYALNEQPWRPQEEILRLDNTLRRELGWPLRGEAFAQPWVETDKSTPHTLHLRYRFQSKVKVQDAVLALENAECSTVLLNGKPAGCVSGWYVDKCIGCRKLPEIQADENVLEITLPYGKTINVEACYLLGNFSVYIMGTKIIIDAPVSRMHFGDMTRQGLPFYGGNLTWLLEPDMEEGTYVLQVSQYRGHLLRVTIDGNDQGVIAFSPYQVRFSVAHAGKHQIQLTLFGSRVNTFGQVHNANKQTEWWGPESWRTQDAQWSYEYQLWPQGILKSPELRRIK